MPAPFTFLLQTALYLDKGRSMKIVVSLVLTLILSSFNANAGVRKKDRGNLYSISVGINKYPKGLVNFNNCTKDAFTFSEKLKAHNGPQIPDSVSKLSHYHVDSVFSTVLLDEQATLENIIQAFRDVALKARSNDVFTFFLAGYTFELKDYETIIYPYTEEEVDIRNIDRSKVLKLTELAQLMNQISCRHQLVVSESGSGSFFATNLLSEVFESNPVLAKHNAHNRVIITTKNEGLDSYFCGFKLLEHGPLLSYMLACGNPLKAIFSPDYYELDLIRAEVKCPVREKRYCQLYNESDFNKFIVRSRIQNNIDTLGNELRGGKNRKLQNEKPSSKQPRPPTTYAICIATNTYTGSTAWSDLKNPINDAEAVSDLLTNKYGVVCIKLYNKDINAIWDGLDAVLDSIRAEDKLILFIAGHGYYNSKTWTAALVTKNSLSLSDDKRLTTYIGFAWLKERLDNLPTENVFAIFDVCFGANFDANANDVVLTNYDKLLQDIPLNQFEARMNEHKTRIFLASGKYEVPDYWNNSLDHSPFAAKIIHGLKNEIAFITPAKLFGFSMANATRPELKYFGQHHTHTDFILMVKD
ncbi:MAG: hypothetical protein ACI9JN_001928 [Bacteroidia bacterium]